MCYENRTNTLASDRSLSFRGDVRDYVSAGKGYSLWLANSHDQEYPHAAAMPVECRRVGQAADLGAGHRDWPCARKWTSCPFGNMIIVEPLIPSWHFFGLTGPDRGMFSASKHNILGSVMA